MIFCVLADRVQGVGMLPEIFVIASAVTIRRADVSVPGGDDVLVVFREDAGRCQVGWFRGREDGGVQAHKINHSMTLLGVANLIGFQVPSSLRTCSMISPNSRIVGILIER